MSTHLDHARLLYNLALEQRSMSTRTNRHFGTRVSFASQCRELTALRAELDWLRTGSTVVQQGALRDLDRAFANFFAGHARYPRFRSAREPKAGFAVRDVSLRRVNRKWAEALVPKAGWVRFRLSYPWHQATTATSARITRHNGLWHLSLTTPPRAKAPAPNAKTVGIDVGVANTIATSDGDFLQAPTLSPGEQSRFLALKRRLARQPKGSSRRAATLEKMAALRRTLERRRTDWVEQATTDLACRYGAAGVEDLRITNMVRRPAPRPDPETPGAWLPNGSRAKAGLNRAILASYWGTFTTRLDHKMYLARVNPANTSRTCHECGHTDAQNRESQAVFECTRCGHQAHADTNAAQNILARTLSTTHNPGTPGARTHQPNTPVGRVNHPTASAPAAV